MKLSMYYALPTIQKYNSSRIIQIWVNFNICVVCWVSNNVFLPGEHRICELSRPSSSTTELEHNNTIPWRAARPTNMLSLLAAWDWQKYLDSHGSKIQISVLLIKHALRWQDLWDIQKGKQNHNELGWDCISVSTGTFWLSGEVQARHAYTLYAKGLLALVTSMRDWPYRQKDCEGVKVWRGRTVPFVMLDSGINM